MCSNSGARNAPCRVSISLVCRFVWISDGSPPGRSGHGVRSLAGSFRLFYLWRSTPLPPPCRQNYRRLYFFTKYSQYLQDITNFRKKWRLFPFWATLDGLSARKSRLKRTTLKHTRESPRPWPRVGQCPLGQIHRALNFSGREQPCCLLT